MRLAAITCIYGLRDTRLQTANYWRCAEGLDAQGLDLWTVEGLLPGQSPRVTGDRVMTCELRDLLWHKERLLQLGVEQLPDRYDAVMWLDADVLFDQPEIRERIEQTLQEYPVLQPYDETRFLDASGRPENGPIDVRDANRPDLGRWLTAIPGYFDRSIAARNAERQPGEAVEPGHPGLAWAMRRDWWHEVGLYQHHMGGSGDETLAQGCLWDVDAGTCRRYSAAQLPHVLAWIRRCYTHVGGRVGHVPGIVRHLWHGPIRGRGYAARQLAMIVARFDPELHLVTEPGRPLRWSDQAPPALVAWMREYLTSGTHSGLPVRRGP